jgi:hypothetical protein
MLASCAWLVGYNSNFGNSLFGWVDCSLVVFFLFAHLELGVFLSLSHKFGLISLLLYFINN